MFDQFIGLSPWGWLVQGIGFCAMALAIISFQQKTQKRIALFQFLNNVFWTLHFILLGTWAGAILNAIGILRGLVFYYRSNHRWAASRVWYAVFGLLFTLAGVFSWIRGDGPLAILPTVAMLITTVSLALRNPFRVRALTLVNSPFWMAYNWIKGSIPGFLNEIIVMCSILIGILRLDLPRFLRQRRQRR